MPELPEVETVRQGLRQLVLNQEIANVEIFWPKIIQTSLDLNQWIFEIQNETIKEVHRRGKYLIFELDHYYLISHLRMEGKYLYFQADDIPEEKDKHTHVIFIFADRSQLHYNDVRKFGRMTFINKNELEEYFKSINLGPEPLSPDFELTTFSQQLMKSQRMVKPLLLDQKLVAGLGNIYVDEALFEAGIHPCRSANSLNTEETRRLYEAIIKVLGAAVEAGGSTIRTYKNTLGEAGKFQLALNVYGRKGELCPRCQTPINKIKVMQRGTHFCPQCQRIEG